MTSIPANQIMAVVPSVLGAGGNPLSLNAVYLTEDTSIPVNTVKSFASATDVASWFGANAIESTLAEIYFSGFVGATKLPSVLYFSQYTATAVAGYLRGGSLSGTALTAIQALSGTITVVIDGVSHVSSAINLSSATSFSNAATLIQTGLQGGTPSTTATVTYDALRSAFVITSSTTGATSTLAFPTASSLVTGLKLTSATGAVLSPGAAATTPAAAMNAIVALTQNWATFLTVFEPDAATKLLFAAWVNSVSAAGAARFFYSAWDTDQSPAAGAAPTSFGAELAAGAYSGTAVQYMPTGGTAEKAAFVCGFAASIDYAETRGRATLAFKSQGGLTADVVDATVASNLIGNGYNFYGSYATANDQFIFEYPGQMPGPWKWVDPYINQIWLNSGLQLALMTLMTSVKDVPYVTLGYNLIRAALQDPINQGVTNGVIQAGVTLSELQRQEVNTAAGTKIDTVLSNSGWYLQVLDPGAIVRGNRGSPVINFWYTDGGSIQKISMASIDIE